MQVVGRITVRQLGDPRCEVVLYNISVPEIAVLQSIHGQEAIVRPEKGITNSEFNRRSVVEYLRKKYDTQERKFVREMIDMYANLIPQTLSDLYGPLGEKGEFSTEPDEYDPITEKKDGDRDPAEAEVVADDDEIEDDQNFDAEIKWNIKTKASVVQNGEVLVDGLPSKKAAQEWIDENL